MARKKVQFNVNPLLSGPSLASRTIMGSPYRELLIADVDVDPEQPRRVFDTESLAELAVSIKEFGVLCPILVQVQQGGTYRLIAGERRLRAAKLAGLETIPAVVDAVEEEHTDSLSKQLVENLQRQDLTPMERALAIGQLKGAYQLSVREIARRLGISKSLVQRSLEALALPDDLQAALIAGASESKVLLLAQVTDREVRRELLQKLDNYTRIQLETKIRELRSGDGISEGALSHGGTDGKGGRDRAKLSPEDQRIVDEMQRTLGTKVELTRKRGKEGQGKLTIEFYSNDDLQEIYRRLVERSF